MKIRATFLLISLMPLVAVADVASNEAILAELKKLNANIERMEKRLDDIDQRVDAIESISVSAASGQATAGPPSPNMIDRMVEAVQMRQESIRYPWMDVTLWENVKKGMTVEEVIGVLGEPILEDPSLFKRIDTVYTYRGRRPMTGEMVLGKVKFYRGKVVSVEAP